MVPSKTVFYRRKWLNRPRHHSHAHILAKIEVEPPSKDYKGVVSGQFAVADCTRIAQLEFDHYSKGRAANDLEKARRFRQEVNDFVDAYEAAVEQLEEDRKAVGR